MAKVKKFRGATEARDLFGRERCDYYFDKPGLNVFVRNVESNSWTVDDTLQLLFPEKAGIWDFGTSPAKENRISNLTS